jgi:hypothetical protein
MPLPSSCLFYRISLLFPKMSDVKAFGYTTSHLTDVSELRTQEPTWLLDTPTLNACVLRYQHQGFQSFQSLTERLGLLHQSNILFYDGTDPKELAHFIEGSAKA